MSLQYLSDNTGKHTAVVIPITDWEAITRKHADLKYLEADEHGQSFTGKKSIMGDFNGVLSKESADQLLKHTEQSRSEWDRDS